MKKTILVAIAALFMSAYTAMADYTFVVPQEPGGGTSVWAEIVARELEPFLGERIRIEYQPGARDVPGFNYWAEDLRHRDPKAIMVSHGGNGVSFLQETVAYDYRDYESVGLMNLDIIAAIRNDVVLNETPIRFASGSGMTPEAMAMTLLLCGPGLSTSQYVDCFKENVIWVNGMRGGERRLAFQRGELNATRENPAAFQKHVQPLIDSGDVTVWFTHGLLDANTGSHTDDPNYPGYQFELLYANIWGSSPSGDFYESYKLVKSFRDGLQKALWMDPSSPHITEVREALLAMASDPAASSAIRSDVGNYEWLIGEAGNAQRDTLMTFITREALQTLVQFNADALGLVSVYKPELVE